MHMKISFPAAFYVAVGGMLCIFFSFFFPFLFLFSFLHVQWNSYFYLIILLMSPSPFKVSLFS